MTPMMARGEKGRKEWESIPPPCILNTMSFSTYPMNIFLEYILFPRGTIFYGSALELLGLKNISGAMVLAAMSKRRALG